MSRLSGSPPYSRVEEITDFLHGVAVEDPYRWLEDQDSPETRRWIVAQNQYARAYLDRIPGRAHIRERVEELVDFESYDSFVKAGNRYFFRKRHKGQEQPSIYFREGLNGEDQLLVDPRSRGPNIFTAIKPIRASEDGSILLYEVKQGGERMGSFELIDVAARSRVDGLPHGYLRGFAFGLDGRSFYYSHEPSEMSQAHHRAVFERRIGLPRSSDTEIFLAGDSPALRVVLLPSLNILGILVYDFSGSAARTSFYLLPMDGFGNPPIPILRDATHHFAPRLIAGKIVALVDADAPNGRIVEVLPRGGSNPTYSDLVPETDARIRHWATTKNYLVVSYVRGARTETWAFDRTGNRVAELPCPPDTAVRIVATNSSDDAVVIEHESFVQPAHASCWFLPSGETRELSPAIGPLCKEDFLCRLEHFRSKDGTSIPMSLFGPHTAFQSGRCPVVMTAYGGFGVPSKPQFSFLVAILVRAGCLFALPHIRGGSEFGVKWHEAATRNHRQVAFDDFLHAADFSIETNRTSPRQLAIFGGSNSGLLVAASLTQRPELFGAVLSIAPLTDMLRYHLFDSAHVWSSEYGTSADPGDFRALMQYSPYHAIRDDVDYPPVLLVAGDADQNCNALHARKLTARLQSIDAANQRTFLDYRAERGHSPVLPLSVRIEALADRISFLWDHIGNGELA